MKKAQRNQIDPWIAWLGDHGVELKNELGLVNEPIQIDKVEKPEEKIDIPEPEAIVQEVVEEQKEEPVE